MTSPVHVLGIGNAIVDVLSLVGEEVLQRLGAARFAGGIRMSTPSDLMSCTKIEPS